MKRFSLVPVLSVLVMTLLTACATSEDRDYAYVDHDRSSYRDEPREVRSASRYGEVVSIERMRFAERTSGGGAVLGAVIGAVIGNQVGSGRGRAAATGAGAVGGAVIGNQIEKRGMHEDELYRVSVRFEDGRSRDYDYERVGDLGVGDHIVDEDGELRVVR